MVDPGRGRATLDVCLNGIALNREVRGAGSWSGGCLIGSAQKDESRFSSLHLAGCSTAAVSRHNEPFQR